MKIPEIEKKDLPALFGKKYQIIKIEEDEVLIRELQDETPRNDDHLLTVKISEIYKKLGLIKKEFSMGDIIDDTEIKKWLL